MRIAWFDDELGDALGMFLPQAIAETGNTVDTYLVSDRQTMKVAVEQFKQNRADLVLFDFKLGDNRDGIDGIRLVQELSAWWLGPALLLTRFGKLSEIGPFVDWRLSIADCMKPDSHDQEAMRAWFSKDLWPALLMHQKTAAARPRPLMDGASAQYLSEPITALDRLSLDQRLSLKQEAADYLISDSESAFDDPQVSYVTYVGWPAKVVRIGKGSDDLPNPEGLRELRRTFDASTLVLRRPARINMVRAVDAPTDQRLCAPTKGPASTTSKIADWFPTLHIELEDSSFDIHTDTGADFSFLSYERLDGVCPSREQDEDWTPWPIQVGVGEMRSLLVSEWRTKIRIRSNSGSLDAKIPVQLVRRFASSGLDAVCRRHCPSHNLANGGSCLFRVGILGRDIFRHTGWVLVVDLAGQRAFVLPPDHSLVSGDGDQLPEGGRFWTRRR